VAGATGHATAKQNRYGNVSMSETPAIRFLNSVRSAVQWPVKILCFLLFSLMVVDVFLAVLTRYILDEPFNFCDAVAKYLLIWFSLPAAGLAVQDKAHIAIDALTRRWSTRYQKLMMIIINAMVSFFLILMIKYGIDYTKRGMLYTDPIVWDLPLVYVYLALPVGLSYILFEFNLETSLYVLSDDGSGTYFRDG
jgi:TRAP-type C4-dicarboxylate transport system permease small subunit